MVFSSVSFLVYFLPVVLFVYFLAPVALKNIVLLVASLFFYAWGEPVYVLLMVASILLNYFFGLTVHRLKTETKRDGQLKAIIAVCVVVNLGILGFFKYGDFLIENINLTFGLSYDKMNLPLPIGISFYTFQAMSYIIDLYRGKVKVQKNLVAFGTYVALFPQLIAGPIVRFETIERQLVLRSVDMGGFASGVRRFVMGLGKKIILANNIGLLWETVSATEPSQLTVAGAWLGALAFTMQIYFDFSGYSDMAIGLGRMFGFEFSENFNYPYLSKSITEFWRRWHISLSSWFREYVYIPLGGNRKGLFRQGINIFIVWTLTGLWHGAAWNFVIWGMYFAVLLMAEKFVWGKYLEKFIKQHGAVGKFAAHTYAMILVIISWVLFAAKDAAYMGAYLKGMFGFSGAGILDERTIYLFSGNFVLLVLCVIISLNLPHRFAAYGKEKWDVGNGGWWGALGNLWIAALLIVSFAYVVASTYNPFLYFRF